MVNHVGYRRKPLKSDEHRFIEASIRGDLSEAASLLEQDVSVNIHDDESWTPLMYAAANGHAALVRFLIDQGADLHQTNSDSQTAFEIAHVRGMDAVLSEFSRFQPQELIGYGGLRWYCPFCGHWAFLGDAEKACEHFFGAGGMDEPWAPDELLEGPVLELVSLAQEWLQDNSRRELLFDNAPSALWNLFEWIDWYGEAFWTELPDLHQGESLEIDEAAGTYAYWDYFAPDPQAVIKDIRAQAQDALVFLKELADRYGVVLSSDE
jgi:hypothetical protein